MGIFFLFLWHLWSNFWWFLTSGPLVVEPMLEYLFPDYEAWANQYISRAKRRQIAYVLSVSGIVAASFFAFQDIYLKLEAKEAELTRMYGMFDIKGREEQTRAMQTLQTANAQLEAELRSTRDQLSSVQESLKPQRVSLEQRMKFTAVLASYDGRQFGTIFVEAVASCHQCLIYLDDIVKAINSVPGWSANGGPNHLVPADFTGLGIAVQDPQVLPPGVHVLAAALTAADLPFRIVPWGSLPGDTLMLIVGSRP